MESYVGNVHRKATDLIRDLQRISEDREPSRAWRSLALGLRPPTVDDAQ